MESTPFRLPSLSSPSSSVFSDSSILPSLSLLQPWCFALFLQRRPWEPYAFARLYRFFLYSKNIAKSVLSSEFTMEGRKFNRTYCRKAVVLRVLPSNGGPEGGAYPMNMWFISHVRYIVAVKCDSNLTPRRSPVKLVCMWREWRTWYSSALNHHWSNQSSYRTSGSVAMLESFRLAMEVSR